MKARFKTCVALAIAAYSLSGMAQSDFVVATGNTTPDKETKQVTSTYVLMFRDIKKVCDNVVPLTEKPSNGSYSNLEFMANKEADAAILQGDVLSFIDQTDPAKVANIKTLFTLAPEELHFIARADVKTEGGINIGGMNFRGTKVEYRTLDDLAGRQVGAVGGSILSGRVVAKQSGLNFQMVDATSNEKLKEDLLNGKFDAILIVGGAPHNLVKGLDQRFRLLPISQETASKLKAYTKATLSYSNLNQAGVPSVQTQALFVTRVFRDPEMQQKLAKLRACVTSKVYALQDAKGTHPKWAQVDPQDKGRWSYYELPAAK